MHYKEKLISSNKKESRREDEELVINLADAKENLAKMQREVREW